MDKERAKVICMTPVKNEEWIMERFLTAASLWADCIIVADQHSQDQTVRICRKFPKVRLIENPSESFNENGRQKLLIREARKIPGKKLLVALDADEFLTGNLKGTSEWEEMVTAAPGTVFRMKWPCIAPDFRHFWMTEGADNIFAMMDDGTPHEGREMHSIRVPLPKNGEERMLSSIEVMHFQYTDWERMKCKNLWYQCYERIHHPDKSVFGLYRMYHHMDTPKKMEKIPDTWYQAYKEAGIDLEKNGLEEKTYWWQTQMKEFVEEYGEAYFRYIDFPQNKNAVLGYLRGTQFLWRYRYGRAILRRMDKVAEKLLSDKAAKETKA